MYRVVIHIDKDDTRYLGISLGNIRNLLNEIGSENGNIVLVANFEAPQLFLKKNINQFLHDQIKTLAKDRVSFLMCENSLNVLNIQKNQLIEECDIIKAGILELVRLQNEGYAYVKP